jgi:hypothetical protein
MRNESAALAQASGPVWRSSPPRYPSTLGAHLLEIGVWAVLFMLCEDFPAFAIACHHSAVNYATLGYGDVIMTATWKFLGPLEAANGMLLFGVSTAMVFAVIQRVIQARFADLRAR